MWKRKAEELASPVVSEFAFNIMNLCSEVKRKMQALLATRQPGVDPLRTRGSYFARISASEEAKAVKITHGEIALARP